MKLLLFQLILHLLVVLAFSSKDMVTGDEWLKNYFTALKKTYDKRVAPIGDNGPGSPVRVNVSMYILDVSHVDDSNMDYTVQIYFRQTWSDPRLRYTYRNQNIVLINADEVWIPDFFFTDSRESKLHHIVQPNAMLRIEYDGSVFYSIRVTVKIPCSFDLRSFPHDIQKCEIRVDSYAHKMEAIIPVWLEKPAVGLSNTITLRNFDIINLNYSDSIERLNIGDYKSLIVTLTLQRKFGFFATKLYVPLFILVVVSLLSLWIRAEERGLRLSLLVIILYFMINISAEAKSEIPSAPYTTGTDVWIGFCESLVFAIFLEFVAVALISGRHGNGDRKGEILLNMESESKEQSLKTDSSHSHLWKLVNMFDARNAGNEKRDASAYRIDKICRFVFPIIFLLFNVVYWSVYCSKSNA